MGQTVAQAAMKKVTEVPKIGDELKKKVDPSRVNIWERRLINPGREASQPVYLKDDSYTVRWVNTASEGRFHRAVYDQGWEVVDPKDLKDDPKMLGFSVVDGTVRRGERAVEVLMRIPTVIFKRIQRRKAQIEIDAIKKTRQNLSEAAANRFGGQAGEWASGRALDGDEAVSGLKGRVLDFHETRVIDSEQDVEESTSEA